jgi:hypothetical protein
LLSLPFFRADNLLVQGNQVQQVRDETGTILAFDYPLSQQPQEKE